MAENRIERYHDIDSQFTGADIISAFLITFLRDHFSKASNIGTRTVRDLVWTDQPDSKLMIEPSYKFDPRKTEKRPAILIKDNDESALPDLSINQEQQGIVKLTGESHFSYLTQGSHTIFCVSPLHQQTRHLSAEVKYHCAHFASMIRSSLNLHRWRWVNSSAISQLEEARENFVRAVTFGYTYEEAFKITQHSPPLQRVKFRPETS